MDLINALVSHHSVLRQLYQQAETDPGAADDFIRHLIVHHTMEEKYFYDLLERFGQARHDALEAVNEHHIIEMIIKDVERFPRDHEQFAIKIEGLGEYTTHHLDEEEAEIFPLAEQLFDAGHLATLGRLFEDAKSRLLGVNLPEVPAAIAAGIGSPGRGGGEKGASADARQPDPAVGLGIGSLKA
jgi:hypothetical protein